MVFGQGEMGEFGVDLGFRLAAFAATVFPGPEDRLVNDDPKPAGTRQDRITKEVDHQGPISVVVLHRGRTESPASIHPLSDPYVRHSVRAPSRHICRIVSVHSGTLAMRSPFGAEVTAAASSLDSRR